MKRYHKILALSLLLTGAAIFAGCGRESNTIEAAVEAPVETPSKTPVEAPPETPVKAPAKENDGVILMTKGISIGNALESPKDIPWGVEMKAAYFDKIKSAGFDTVRLPVRFSDYAAGDDYALDEAFMQKVDYFITYGLGRGLTLVLDFHHFEELMTDPAAQKEKFLKIWAQLSERYKDYPEELIFEVLNEPKSNLGGELWNELLAEAIGVIREQNPDRRLIAGADSFNSLEALERLKLPQDENIIVTFHYYVPNDFAFQGNPYHEGYEDLKDITWTGDSAQMERIVSDFAKVRAWADKNGSPSVFLGEFGIVKTVPPEYRNEWIKAVKSTAEQFGFSWAYWEFASHFGIYDASADKWNDGALDALIGNN